MDSRFTLAEESLLKALAMMAAQWMTNSEGLVWHSFTSSNERTVELLERYGMLAPNGPPVGGWKWTEQGKELIPDYF
jgi:hypothetical protein